MEQEERIDLNDRRLNDHATRVTRLEEQMKMVSEDIECHRQETRTGFTEVKAEIRTYFAPITALTAKHDRSILSLEKDMGWMKPWFKRLTIGTATILGGGLSAQWLMDYVSK